MQKPKEIAEISLALWYLPLSQVERVRDLVHELRRDHGYDRPTDDSDEWLREDELDATRASAAYLDSQNPEDEGYGDVPTG
jgi:hypothetical protein